MSLSREGLKLPVDSGGVGGGYEREMKDNRETEKHTKTERGRNGSEGEEMHVFAEDRAPSAKKCASL